MAFVAGGIALEFFPPPGALGLWNTGGFAVPVQVPKTAVHENAGAVLRKDDVRRAGQIGPVEAEAIAQGVEQAAHGESGFVSLPRIRLINRLRSSVERGSAMTRKVASDSL